MNFKRLHVCVRRAPAYLPARFLMHIVSTSCQVSCMRGVKLAMNQANTSNQITNLQLNIKVAAKNRRPNLATSQTGIALLPW